jgi:hypothetical protein
MAWTEINILKKKLEPDKFIAHSTLSASNFFVQAYAYERPDGSVYIKISEAPRITLTGMTHEK